MTSEQNATYWWDLKTAYASKHSNCKCADHEPSECPFLKFQRHARLIWERVEYQPIKKPKRAKKSKAVQS